jgi:hypothetical protein
MAIANTILHCVITWHVASLWFVPGYNSSIFESDIKHYNLNPYPYITNIRYVLVITEFNIFQVRWTSWLIEQVYVVLCMYTLYVRPCRCVLDRSIYDINQWNNIYLQMRSCIYAFNPWRAHRQVKKEWK